MSGFRLLERARAIHRGVRAIAGAGKQFERDLPALLVESDIIISSTSAKACHQPRHTEAPLPRHHAQAKASSINTLRFVGTEKPAKPA